MWDHGIKQITPLTVTSDIRVGSRCECHGIEIGTKIWNGNRTALEKCTHLYDDRQGTIKHKRFRQTVFDGCMRVSVESACV